jgi:O-antigen/teichoic acid export membrane protein
VVGAIFATVWLVVAARALGPTDFGRFAVVIGIGTVAAVVVEGGYPLLVAEAVGANPTHLRTVVRGAMRVRFPLALLGGAATAGIAGLIGGRTAALTGAVYGMWIVASAFQTTFGPALRAVGRVGTEGMAEAACRLLTLLVGVPLLWSWRSPVAVALAYTTGTSLVSVGLWRQVRVVASSAGPDGWGVPARRVLPLGAAAVLVTLYNRVDVWLLATIATAADVGVYAAGYRFYEGLVLPATAFGALLVPAAAAEPRRSEELVRAYVRGALALALVGSVTMAVMAPILVRHLLGERFGGAVTPIRILAAAALPATVFTAVAPLVSLRSRHGSVGLLLLGVGATVALNSALIPLMGADGAAMAMVLSQTLMAVVFWRSVKRGAGVQAVGSLSRIERRRRGATAMPPVAPRRRV